MRLHQVGSVCMPVLRWLRSRRRGVFIVLVIAVMIPLVGKALLQNSPPNTPRNVPEFLNRPPDFSDQERMRQEQRSQQGIAAINALRKKQVTDDTAKLLKLATDLKAEIDNTDKDTVSHDTLHKAESIEKLARSIKQKMSTSAIPN